MPIPAPRATSRRTRRDVAWAVRHRSDCVPEATSGRADPDRGGRHQHTLRDLDGCSAGDAAGGAQAAAPLVDAPTAPGSDEAHPIALARGRRGTALRVDADGLCGADEGDLEAVLRFDPLTGISVLVARATVPAMPPALARRVEETGRIQALAGGVRPGDCDLATALVRRAGERVSRSAGDTVALALWGIMADGDLGDSQGRSDAARRSHGVAGTRPLGLTPRQLAARCRDLVAEVEARAAEECRRLLAAPLPVLDAAVLEQVRLNPDTAERGIAAALAGMGATQGRVYRALGRLGLTTRVARSAWVAAGCPGCEPTPGAVAAAAARLSAGDPGLAPLYRYHIAAALCRLRCGTPEAAASLPA